MRKGRLAIYPVVAITALLSGLVLAGATPVQAAALPSYALYSVAGTSARNVWAVGTAGGTTWSRPLIEHWTGKAWKQVHGPSPHLSQLNGVAVISAKDAWAVGDSDSTGPLSTTSQTLIEHWNGKVWKVVKSPSRPDGAFLEGVSAWSANDVWAVGSSGDYLTNASRTLVLHWNGKVWKQVPSPTPRQGGRFGGVTVISAGDAWAVGTTSDYRGVIEHWNGTAWTLMPELSPAGGVFFNVAGTSTSNAWIVGNNGGGYLTVHWNGSTWTLVSSPSGNGSLTGLAVVSARDIWADGWTHVTAVPRIEHWNGASWSTVRSPRVAVGSVLWGMAAISARDIWAVGWSGDGYPVNATLIEQWNGKTWKQIPGSP
jgi:hypothetical protein